MCADPPLLSEAPGIELNRRNGLSTVRQLSTSQKLTCYTLYHGAQTFLDQLLVLVDDTALPVVRSTAQQPFNSDVDIHCFVRSN